MFSTIAERDEAEARAAEEAGPEPSAQVITDEVVLEQTAPVISDQGTLGPTAPVINDQVVLGPRGPLITDPPVLSERVRSVSTQDVLGLPLPLDDDQIFHAEMERKFNYGKKGRKNAVLHEDSNEPKKTMLHIFLYLWANTFAVSNPCHNL
jgi:hypothetical protein